MGSTRYPSVYSAFARSGIPKLGVDLARDLSDEAAAGTPCLDPSDLRLDLRPVPLERGLRHLRRKGKDVLVGEAIDDRLKTRNPLLTYTRATSSQKTRVHSGEAASHWKNDFDCAASFGYRSTSTSSPYRSRISLEAGPGLEDRCGFAKQRLVDRPAVLKHLHPVDPPEPATPAVLVEDRPVDIVGVQKGEGLDRIVSFGDPEAEAPDVSPPNDRRSPAPRAG